MPLFALTPIPAEESHPNWEASTYCGTCCVTAADERRARIYAANAFLNSAASRTDAGLMRASPWTTRKLVTSEPRIGWSIGAASDGTVLVPSDPTDPLSGYRVFRSSRL